MESIEGIEGSDGRLLTILHLLHKELRWKGWQFEERNFQNESDLLACRTDTVETAGISIGIGREMCSTQNRRRNVAGRPALALGLKCWGNFRKLTNGRPVRFRFVHPPVHTLRPKPLSMMSFWVAKYDGLGRSQDHVLARLVWGMPPMSLSPDSPSREAFDGCTCLSSFQSARMLLHSRRALERCHECTAIRDRS
jgi:hypothetical protein